MIELAGEIETTEDLRRFLIDVEARLHNVSRPLVDLQVEEQIQRLQVRLEQLIQRIQNRQDSGQS